VLVLPCNAFEEGGGSNGSSNAGGDIPNMTAHERGGPLVDVGDQAAVRAALARFTLDGALRLPGRSAARAKAASLDVAYYSERLLRLCRSVVQQPAGAVRGRRE
jgi:hypothetical protein